MPVKLAPQTQTLVDTLLTDRDQDRRRETLKLVNALPDKDQVEIYLLDEFDQMQRWEKTWTLTILSAIGLPVGKQAVIKHTSESDEPDPWVRHFALLNAAGFTPFPYADIDCAVQDGDVLPRATALRLLVANGEDRRANELLNMLQDVNDGNARWAAARALRNRKDIPTTVFRAPIENKFIPCLMQIASDINVYLDTRWEAIQTLTSFEQKAKVAQEMAELLAHNKDKDPAIRRYSLDSLMTLRQAPESQEALLIAIEDADAQIRLDAAKTLKELIGADACVKKIVPLAMKPETDCSLLVDALRHIDSDLAAKAMREYLGNADIATSTRANQLLTMLGGQTAAQILMNERARALKDYTSLLSDADRDVRNHFKDLMFQAKASFWLSLFMHLVVFDVGIGLLVASLFLAFKDGLTTVSGLIGVGGAGTSALMIILSTFYSSPLKNIRESLNALLQVDVVFLGYVRQINQIDATFKHMFLDARDFGPQEMKATVGEIKESVSKILEEIKTHIHEKRKK